MPTVALVPLAKNQARFYLGVAKALRNLGVNACFICFHEPSVRMLVAGGFDTFNFFEFLDATAGDPKGSVQDLARRYAIENANRLITHEKITYETRDSRYLLRKLSSYLVAAERLLDVLKARCGIPEGIVQELGGFISVASIFYAARARGWAHVFVEPSFFQGRVFLLRNTFSAPQIAPDAIDIAPEVQAYLERSLRNKQVVIPAKDTGHYRSALRKILSVHNIRRLVEKTAQKYVRLEREEFTHLRTQIQRHARMLTADLLLRRYASPLTDGRRFVYYPLHVWTDVALTLRAPEYLDQYWLLDYLARNVPPTHVVKFKEHPAMVGGLGVRRVRDLLHQHDNLILLHPWINNYEVMRAADAVVTVNSKSGAEALLLGKPVLALGDSFYRSSGLAATVASVAEIPGTLAALIQGPPPAQSRIEQFFEAVWEHSYPGELYVDGSENCQEFAHSVLTFLTADASKAVSH